ncbi:AAA family ATPase, partial [Treponema sp.]|uniref:AAA family ATPase n=1 Tax=Treponema sp. TaxID=166 RepID=UPI003FA31D02
ATLNWIYINQDALNTLKISEPITQKDFIFIIDEINRGEISKIFGELFFSVDPGYRGKKGLVKTQYQNLVETGDIFEDGFYVPENVYIIGTMNDIDRSVESMDFAMRRRFAFKEITAAQSAENFELSENTKTRMESLNNAISKIDGLNSAYHIGAAYFKQLDDDMETSDELWENSLHDLLVEYLKGSGNEESNLELLKNAFDMINIE